MIYGIKVTQAQDGFRVTCRDIPECVYVVKTEDEAQALSQELLPGCLVLYYRKKHKAFPMPTKLETDEIPVHVPVRIQAKMLFWNFLQYNGIRLADVAKKLGISNSAAARLVDLTKDLASIDAVEQAFAAYNRDLDLVADF